MRWRLIKTTKKSSLRFTEPGASVAAMFLIEKELKEVTGCDLQMGSDDEDGPRVGQTAAAQTKTNRLATIGVRL